jgi:uncharacterized CHY-type Zn-finger protein
MWYDDPLQPKKELIKVEAVICPVCKAILAHRDPQDRLWTRCKECKTDFYFPPCKAIPTIATPDSCHGGTACGCGRCGR